MKRDNLIWGLLLTIVILMNVVSCERFDNKFEPLAEDKSFEIHLEAFIQDMKTGLLSANLTEVMAQYYSDDYLNDGLSKQDIESFFSDLATNVTEALTIQLVSFDKTYLNFSYRIEDINTDLDTTIIEYASLSGDTYLFIGNRVNPEESEESRVLVELFTATWCPNCPYVEAALHQLKQELGDKFHYIEYHIMDVLDKGNMDILNYYQLPTSLPVGVVQGSLKISGGSVGTSYNEYKFAIEQFSGKEAEYSFEDFSYSVAEGELSFQIKLSKKGVIGDDLRLRYALIDKETTVPNSAGVNSKNVAIAKGILELSEESFDGSLDLSLTITNHPFIRPAVVVWFQTINDPYDNQTSLVSNVKEFEIEIP